MPPIRFEISFPAERSSEALDGRLLLILSTVSEPEPRWLIGDNVKTQQVFGMDVNGLRTSAPPCSCPEGSTTIRTRDTRSC